MNYYKGSINNPEFQKTRGYICGAFENAPVFSKKMETACMVADELRKHVGMRHHHNVMDEFSLVLEGRMEMEVGNDLLKLEKGDFVFLKAGTSAALKKVNDDTILFVVKAPSVPSDKIND